MSVSRILADDEHPSTVTRYGEYLCLHLSDDPGVNIAEAIAALIDTWSLQNEFEPPDADARTVAFLRRTDAAAGSIADERLQHATAVIHVACETPEPILEFRSELRHLLPTAVAPGFLGGVVRPLRYTGNAMHNFAYAHRVLPQSGSEMPSALLVPMNKTAAWWQKGWMERHTFFLPRYDASGQMVSEGHALAAAAGISCLMRRTYWNVTEPAPSDEYDFVNYFECADEDVPVFYRVCEALRDVGRNPEWAFVREGPTWRGRRVPTWAELFR